MNPNNAIEVRNVSVTFRKYFNKSYSLKEKLIHRTPDQYEMVNVIKDLSFEVKKGEAVGLIGENGCGKSTTLKLLAGILYPDSGTVEIQGRISSLLELGAGFHQDLSGRENIYINASIMGLSMKEIREKMDSIIDFAEMEDCIDNPVKTYSTGMYMRLAFSIAINVCADIILIDEILAVGDVRFQAKCFDKLIKLKQSGVTIVLVSHSMEQIEKICDKSIWLIHGELKEEGEPRETGARYLNYMTANQLPQAETNEITKEQDDLTQNNGTWSFKRISQTNAGGSQQEVFSTGEELRLEMELEAPDVVSNIMVEINLVREDGLFCCGVSAGRESIVLDEAEKTVKFYLCFKELNLLNGSYHFDLNIVDGEAKSLFFAGNVCTFQIRSERNERGMLYLRHAWMKE